MREHGFRFLETTNLALRGLEASEADQATPREAKRGVLPMAEPTNLYADDAAMNNQRRVFPFTWGEALVEHGIVQRVEFTDKRCNLTLKNPTTKRQRVSVRVQVLNSDLVELWRQAEHWKLSRLQPDQSHVLSWEFLPQVPEVIWNLHQRQNNAPAWVLIYTG